MTYAPWSGWPDLHRPSPAPQAGGTLPSLHPEVVSLVNRALPILDRCPVFPAALRGGTDASEGPSQSLVRCARRLKIMEGPLGVAPSLSGPQPEVQNCYTSAPNVGRPGRSRTCVSRLSGEDSAVEPQAVDGVTGNDPASPPWQRGALPLCYTPRYFWLPRHESNVQLAASKAALRTDTECVAVVGA